MAATRNFHRNCWLLFYLFGASPSACRSFFGNSKVTDLKTIDSHTVYGQFATSLRMSNFGYRNPVQSEIRIDHNSIENYIESLNRVIRTPFPKYEHYGVRKNGEYLQLNSNLLQIENEYYSVIRPKRRTMPLEQPSVALRERGVEYLEVRCLDLDPFEPNGISDSQARFLDVFLIYCLLCPSPPMTDEHAEIIAANKDAVVLAGRTPTLKLQANGKFVELRQWAQNLLRQLDEIANIFDDALDSTDYRQAVKKQQTKVDDPCNTPSAKIVDELISNQEPFFSFAMRRAKQIRKTITNLPLEENEIEFHAASAKESFDKQREMEQQDKESFDEFLAHYFKR